MKTLFPEIRPYRTEMLDVGDGQQLYLECSGSASAIPVLVIHGGPGAGSNEQLRRFFDPERYHIIVFDQRGAGRSLPYAQTDNNQMHNLIDDIEAIRKHLSISRWLLFGGSFGATLALLYAQQYPLHVCGFVLRGTFLARQQDIDWFYQASGAARFFPEEWQRFTDVIDGDGSDIIEQVYHIVHSENELARIAAAKAWGRWEAANISLRPSSSAQAQVTNTHTAIAMARIGSHYLRQRCFIEENQIMNNIDQIKHIPAYIVHGRYDTICPPEQAKTLADAWPEAELDLVREGGHSAYEPAIVDAVIRSTQRMAKRLGSPESEA